MRQSEVSLFSDHFVEAMIECWPVVSPRTFKRIYMVRINTSIQAKRVALTTLERVHPRVLEKLRVEALARSRFKRGG